MTKEHVDAVVDQINESVVDPENGDILVDDPLYDDGIIPITCSEEKKDELLEGLGDDIAGIEPDFEESADR